MALNESLVQGGGSVGYQWISTVSSSTKSGPNSTGIAIGAGTLNDFEAEIGGPFVRMRWVITTTTLGSGATANFYLLKWEKSLGQYARDLTSSRPSRFLFPLSFLVGWGEEATGNNVYPPSFVTSGGANSASFTFELRQNTTVKVSPLWASEATVLPVQPLAASDGCAVWAARDAVTSKLDDSLVPAPNMVVRNRGLGSSYNVEYTNTLSLRFSNLETQQLDPGRLVLEMVAREI